nr:winged helix-turn-helix domain-containing protein [Bianquea renquensis]
MLKILKKGDATVSQLSRIFHVSRTSIIRLVQALEKELILISYRDGWEHYYRINYDYLFYAKQKIDTYFDGMMVNT